jgi:hypothetical protein
MAYGPNEPLTLADQLRLLAQTMPEDEAKARLDKLFRFRGRSIYSPKYAVSYEDAAIDFATGRVVLRRLPRQSFTPTLTAAAHYALFPQSTSGADRPASEALSEADVKTAAQKRRRGPAPGDVDRYADVDRQLFPELEQIMREERRSVSAAAKKLAEAGRVSGPATVYSKGKRLAERYRCERQR